MHALIIAEGKAYVSEKGKCSKADDFDKIEPLPIEEFDDVSGFIENVFGKSGFNARRLAEACAIYRRMLEEDATICLTLAGAMTPIGMSGPLIKLMEKGCVDFIISTGANLYHDLHRAFDMPMVQGNPHADDNLLREEGWSRILDVYIDDVDTLMSTDRVVLESIVNETFEKPISTADLHEILGKHILKAAPHAEKSFVAAAAKHGVPIYVPSPGDSSIGMSLIIPHIFGKSIPLDPLLDVIETTSLIRAAQKNGVIIVGGGSPKNFYMQTQPTLSQILRDDIGGHDYFIQMTIDAPEYGGLSGATPSEAVSWGKIRDSQQNCVVVNSCCSIVLPLLAKYALSSGLDRKPKNLLTQKAGYVKELIEIARKNPNFKQAMEGLIDI